MKQEGRYLPFSFGTGNCLSATQVRKMERKEELIKSKFQFQKGSQAFAC